MNLLKKGGIILTVTGLLLGGTSPIALAQDITPGELLTNVQEKADFDALKEIESGNFSIKGEVSIKGVEEIFLDVLAEGSAVFNVQKEEQNIEFFGQGTAEFEYEHESTNGVESGEKSGYTVLKEGVLYSYNGSEYFVESAEDQIKQFFENYDKEFEKLIIEYQDQQDIIFEAFDESFHKFADKYFTVEDKGSAYTLTFNTNAELSEFVSDLKQTKLYQTVLETIHEEIKESTDNNTKLSDADLEKYVSSAEAAIAFIITLVDEYTLTYQKDSYIQTEGTLYFSVNADNILQAANLFEKTTGSSLADETTKMNVFQLIANIDCRAGLSIKLDNINGEVDIQVPDDAPSLEEYQAIQESSQENNEDISNEIESNSTDTSDFESTNESEEVTE